jgi:hypothetical protein
MPKRPSPRPRSVREPVQVYLAADDSALLASLADSSGLSKAEVLRRGLRSFGREQGRSSPMLRFAEESARADWPDAVAAQHDEVLADEYLGRPRRRS